MKNTLIENFKNFCTSKIVQGFFVLFIVQAAQGQQLSFKLSHDGIIQTEFYIKAFKNNGYQLYKSKDSVISVQPLLLKSADSVKLYYSFYEEIFDLHKLDKGFYIVTGQMSLETILINGNKQHEVLKLKGYKATQFGGTYAASSIVRDKVKGNNLHGIELYFKESGQSNYRGNKTKFNNTNKKFTLIVALSNSRDSIYPNNIPHVTHEFSVDKKGWNYYKLDGFDFDLNDFKYIVVILLPEPGSNMGLGIRWLPKKEKGVLEYHRRITDDRKEIYYVKAHYQNGDEITDMTLDFRLHYSE